MSQAPVPDAGTVYLIACIVVCVIVLAALGQF
jgi:hypothetical protein